VERWCDAKRVERGYVMSLDQAWALSRRWYGNRLNADFRRPTADEARALFDDVGLTGSFWRLS
jgi:hypothetical protein